MTALCPGGGASSPKLGASAVTLLASGFIAVALDRYGAGWLKWAIPFLAFPELTLNTFCATDPPAIPTFTAAEAKALVELTLGADFASGLSKFGDLVQHLVWYDLCQCNSGTPTALPAAPAPPAGTPVYTPPAAQLATKCGVDAVPYGPYHGTGSQYSNFVTTPGATSAAVHMDWNYVGGTHSGADVTVYWLGPGLTKAMNPVNLFHLVEGVHVDATVIVPVGAVTLHVDLVEQVPPVSTSNTLLLQVDYYCGGYPGALVSPCCPPDPATQLQIEAILRMVTLLQRQLVPFAHLTSTAHAGLTGAGTIAVQGLLGVQIDLTTIPATYHQDTSTPPFIFNIGWVSMQDANGFIDETRVHAQHQVWMSRIASDATVIGYKFSAGVVATITELQREP